METMMEVLEAVNDQETVETCVCCGRNEPEGHCNEYPIADGRLLKVCYRCDLDLYPDGSNNQAFEDSLKPLALNVHEKVEQGLILTPLEEQILKLSLRQEQVEFVKDNLWSL
jgi:hypothetical protein